MHAQRKSCTTAPMDPTTSHPLPDVGSFSYSWPTSRPKLQLEEHIDHGDNTTFIGTDPASQSSFDFRLPPSEQAAAMADADQMFLDGLLLRLQLVSQQGEVDGSTGPVLLRSLSLDSSQRMIISASKRHRLTQPASLSSSPSGPRCGAALWRGDPREILERVEGRRLQDEQAQAAAFREIMQETAQGDCVQVP